MVLNKMMLVAAMLGTTLAYAETNSDFDKVVYNNELSAPVRMGFGGHKLLKLIAVKEVKAEYQRIQSMGSIEVLAEKLPSQNKGETETTRFTFNAWQQKGFGDAEKVATLVVDTYELVYGPMDGGRTRYRVGEVQAVIASKSLEH